MHLRNHIGDVSELISVKCEIDSDAANSKEREEIDNFIHIIKFGFEHIGRNVEDQSLETINNSFLKVKCLELKLSCYNYFVTTPFPLQTVMSIFSKTIRQKLKVTIYSDRAQYSL